MRSIVLDNEAVQALTDPQNAKHRTVVAHLAGVISRRRPGRTVEVVVPTAVRVEAAWDRTSPSSAGINRFPIHDDALDAPAADLAASIQRATLTGVADSHLGATVQRQTSSEIVVLTSDPKDVAAACSPVAVRIVPV